MTCLCVERKYFSDTSKKNYAINKFREDAITGSLVCSFCTLFLVIEFQ